MAIIISIVSLIILTLIYRKMILQETPSPIDRRQAVVPVILGLISTPLSFLFFMAIGASFTGAGTDFSGLSPVVHSVISALLRAGIPEEIAKLLLILLSIRIFRSKIKNVYEYVLVGAAVGFGFTLFEEFLYGSGSMIQIVGRLITLAAHMIFGMIMAKHLGLAQHNKKTGKNSVSGEYAKAILIPLAIHTIYDAFTACNYLMSSEQETTEMIGMVLSLASIVVLFILQFRVIGEFRKNAQTYCNMEV